MEFLRNVTIGYAWSHELLSRVEIHNLSFQILYRELKATLQLDKEASFSVALEKSPTEYEGLTISEFTML